MDEPGMVAERPLPKITPLTEPFWSAAKARRLMVQRCEACGAYLFPPERGCTSCGALRMVWVEVSGKASLYSWTIALPPLLPYFAERAPWPIAVVELEEGPRMVTNLAGVPLDDYRAGLPLLADFEDVDDETTLVVFRRA